MLPALILLALVAAACGGERTFEPDEFIDEANAEGAGLVLGPPLTSIEEGVDVFQVSFGEPGTAPAAGAHPQTGGSMIITEDAGSAREEWERCESTVSLTCYRAANVVLYFDTGPTDEHVARVDAAIRALAEG